MRQSTKRGGKVLIVFIVNLGVQVLLSLGLLSSLTKDPGPLELAAIIVMSPYTYQ